MRFFVKTTFIVSAAFFLLVLQAEAVLITFGGQTATDGSGLTSSFVDAGNVNVPNSGYIIETFDQPSSVFRTITTDNGGLITVGAGGGFNTLDPTKLDVTGGLGIREGSVGGVAATPAGDTTFFAFGPGPDSGTTNATLKVENSDFYAYQPGLFIRYLGLYYGSIDTYNNIAFFSGDELLITSSGYLSDGILQGSEILDALNGTSGNQTQPGSNVYVNLAFESDEIFTAFEFRTTGIAFELDNIVAGVAPIPEPATMLLLGTGLLGLAGVNRKRIK